MLPALSALLPFAGKILDKVIPDPEAKAKAQAVEVEDVEIVEPVKRATKKPEEAPAPKKNLASVISAWSDA